LTLRSRLNRKATPGVRMEDQPLPESYWELAPREALKPWVKGIMPLGPALFVVAEAVLLPTTLLADRWLWLVRKPVWEGRRARGRDADGEPTIRKAMGLPELILGNYSGMGDFRPET
jgi:hypothetical protein